MLGLGVKRWLLTADAGEDDLHNVSLSHAEIKDLPVTPKPRAVLLDMEFDPIWSRITPRTKHA